MASKKKAEKSPEKATPKAVRIRGRGQDSGSTVTLKRKDGQTIICNKGDEHNFSEWMKGFDRYQ